MGWGYGINSEGRKVGYDVSATCDHPACNKEIDRGLAYVCGDMHDGGEHGCGRYFCEKHLIHTGIGQFCEECYDNLVKCGGFKSCRDKDFDPDEDDCMFCLEIALDTADSESVAEKMSRLQMEKVDEVLRNLDVCGGFKSCRDKDFDPDDKDCQACSQDAQDGMNECLKDITEEKEENSLPTLPWSFP